MESPQLHGIVETVPEFHYGTYVRNKLVHRRYEGHQRIIAAFADEREAQEYKKQKWPNGIGPPRADICKYMNTHTEWPLKSITRSLPLMRCHQFLPRPEVEPARFVSAETLLRDGLFHL